MGVTKSCREGVVSSVRTRRERSGVQRSRGGTPTRQTSVSIRMRRLLGGMEQVRFSHPNGRILPGQFFCLLVFLRSLNKFSFGIPDFHLAKIQLLHFVFDLGFVSH